MCPAVKLGCGANFQCDVSLDCFSCPAWYYLDWVWCRCFVKGDCPLISRSGCGYQNRQLPLHPLWQDWWQDQKHFPWCHSGWRPWSGLWGSGDAEYFRNLRRWPDGQIDTGHDRVSGSKDREEADYRVSIIARDEIRRWGAAWALSINSNKSRAIWEYLSSLWPVYLARFLLSLRELIAERVS